MDRDYSEAGFLFKFIMPQIGQIKSAADAALFLNQGVNRLIRCPIIAADVFYIESMQSQPKQ